MKKERITVATTTGITTIAVDSICAYTYVTTECVQIHLESGTIFTTTDFNKVRDTLEVVKEVKI